MLVELAAESHRVDRHWLAVVVEDNDLKEPARAVGADVEITVALIKHADSVVHRVFYVGIFDAVLAGSVRNLHLCRLPCLMG